MPVWISGLLKIQGISEFPEFPAEFPEIPEYPEILEIQEIPEIQHISKNATACEQSEHVENSRISWNSRIF